MDAGAANVTLKNIKLFSLLVNLFHLFFSILKFPFKSQKVEIFYLLIYLLVLVITKYFFAIVALVIGSSLGIFALILIVYLIFWSIFACKKRSTRNEASALSFKMV
jgi:cbb3-type cytochrome oxidase subunit 3